MRRETQGWIRLYLHDVLFRLRNGGRDVWSVSIADGDVVLRKNGMLHAFINLEDVRSIEAVNRDMFTWEEIVLVFASAGKTLSVYEFTEGFDRLAEEIATRFPGPCEGWRKELNGVPAFVEKRITVWEKR
jgi:hypothetical protein